MNEIKPGKPTHIKLFANGKLAFRYPVLDSVEILYRAEDAAEKIAAGREQWTVCDRGGDGAWWTDDDAFMLDNVHTRVESYMGLDDWPEGLGEWFDGVLMGWTGDRFEFDGGKIAAEITDEPLPPCAVRDRDGWSAPIDAA